MESFTGKGSQSRVFEKRKISATAKLANYDGKRKKKSEIMSPARILKPIDDSSILHDQLLASLFVV
jgi:hypothetical protein